MVAEWRIREMEVVDQPLDDHKQKEVADQP